MHVLVQKPVSGSAKKGWAEEQNDNGYLFHKFLSDAQLYAFNTRFSNKEGCTWSHKNNGPFHRIDYVVASRKLYDCAHDCYTQRDYDKLHDKEDHFPVTAEFVGRIQGRTSHDGTIQYDKIAVRDKGKVAIFVDNLNRQRALYVQPR